MAHGRSRDERKERQWRRWIELWRASGLTIRAFCARHRLATHNFYAWRRTLEQRGIDQGLFVPVQVVADTPPVTTTTLEVVVTEGLTVRVAPGFDPPTLRQLLALLQEGRRC